MSGIDQTIFGSVDPSDIRSLKRQLQESAQREQELAYKLLQMTTRCVDQQPFVDAATRWSDAVQAMHDAPSIQEAAPFADAAALALHMGTLQDETVRERMGAHARAAVLPLTAAAMTAQLIALYEALLAGRTAP